MIDFRVGDVYPRVVLLGACPGQFEFLANPQRPFAGQAGVNLSHLLMVLRDLPDKAAYGFEDADFASINHDDYTLMNSHDEAKWLAQGVRSTPRMAEVGAPQNLQRLRDQLDEVEARIVIGLGRPILDHHLTRRGKDSGPMRAIRLLAPEYPAISFVVTGHPSQKAINGHGNGNAADWFLNKLHVFP